MLKSMVIVKKTWIITGLDRFVLNTVNVDVNEDHQ